MMLETCKHYTCVDDSVHDGNQKPAGCPLFNMNLHCAPGAWHIPFAKTCKLLAAAHVASITALLRGLYLSIAHIVVDADQWTFLTADVSWNWAAEGAGSKSDVSR